MEQHSWLEVLSFKMKNDFRAFLNTSFPAEVVAVHSFGSKQFVDVKPLIHPQDEEGEILDTPIIYDVPILFQSAAGGLLSFPVEVGDTMMLIISQRSISQWLIGNGSATATKDFDNFEITDAVAIPGLYTQSTNLRPNTRDVELKFAGNSIRQTPDGDTFITAPNNITVDAGSDVTVTAGGNISASAGGNITANAGGSLTATATSSATVEAPNIALTGNVTVTGNFLVTGNAGVGGSLTNAGVNVGANHRHNDVVNGDDTSGTPI